MMFLPISVCGASRGGSELDCVSGTSQGNRLAGGAAVAASVSVPSAGTRSLRERRPEGAFGRPWHSRTPRPSAASSLVPCRTPLPPFVSPACGIFVNASGSTRSLMQLAVVMAICFRLLLESLHRSLPGLCTAFSQSCSGEKTASLGDRRSGWLVHFVDPSNVTDVQKTENDPFRPKGVVFSDGQIRKHYGSNSVQRVGSSPLHGVGESRRRRGGRPRAPRRRLVRPALHLPR